jgi:hypothetical protein
MGAGSDGSRVTVYAQSRWPTRAIAAFCVAVGIAFVATGVILLVIVFTAMGVLFLVAGERRRVRVSPQGVTSVPPLGRSRSSPWSDIDGFAARRYSGKYPGWVVSMSVHGTWIELPATRIASSSSKSRGVVEGFAAQLNEELRRARGRG